MNKKSILIGIAGGTASGKTSVANHVHEVLGGTQDVVLIAQDSYYRPLDHLPMHDQQHVNFDHPDSLDNELLIAHLKKAMNGEVIEIPVYDHKTHSRGRETQRIEPHKIIILEGILILEHERLRDMMDIKVYIDTDADIRFIRRITRDVKERARTFDSVIEQYEKFVRPMHLQFVEPSKRHADIIIPHGIENKVGVDILMTKIRSILHE